jgi:hypothetical protein
MDTVWFYLDGEQRHGPVALKELVAALLANPNPHRVRVWRAGWAEWQSAGSVPEIREKLPPPDPASQSHEDALRSVPFKDAEAIARLYRRLVLLVGLQLVLGFGQLPARTAPSPATNLLSLLVAPVLLVLLVVIAVTAYKLTRHLGEGLPVLWAIAMFLPCINIIGLLVLSSKAQAWCRQYGIKVGFFGPTKESIEELRRRGVTSDFQ